MHLLVRPGDVLIKQEKSPHPPLDFPMLDSHPCSPQDGAFNKGSGILPTSTSERQPEGSKDLEIKIDEINSRMNTLTKSVTEISAKKGDFNHCAKAAAIIELYSRFPSIAMLAQGT
jgi:hypothetical protein